MPESTPSPGDRSDCVDDKYLLCNFNEQLLVQKQYFCSLQLECKGVKGNLKNHIFFWRSRLDASSFVLDTIEKGYVIPFIDHPPSMYKGNNRSALSNAEFVNEAVNELVSLGCVVQVPFKPYIVSPLSVATNSSGKKRLILDLSILNLFVRKDKVKFEDWKLAVEYFHEKCYMIKFDLKSGYFHIDISPSQMSYLGFSWQSNFYCYSVLPFGLSSAPYIFTKCLRPMVKYWRQHSVRIVLYLDDGICMAPSQSDCFRDCHFVIKSLKDAGFVINETKSVLQPSQSLEWLGIEWNSINFSLHIPARRIDDCVQVLQSVLDRLPMVSARDLARCTGKIISMSPVIGNVCRLMSRNCYRLIESRTTWDCLLPLGDFDLVSRELNFWLLNLTSLNSRCLKHYSRSDAIVFSDASSVAAGAICVQHDQKVFHQMFSESERCSSSTYRELLAIKQALLTFENDLMGKTVKLFTDSQNCVRIVQSGSSKPVLQDLALSIFYHCLHKNMSIDVQWIPRDSNTQADYVSKLCDFDDWCVSHEFFEFMNSFWGPHSIDRFASYLNAHLPRFNSLFWNPGTEAVDAFTQFWGPENNWLVPPIHLIIRTIRHIRYCNARATLIVPKWVSAPFWPMIFDCTMCYLDGIVDVLEFKDTCCILKKGFSNSFFGSEKFKGSILAVRFEPI